MLKEKNDQVTAAADYPYICRPMKFGRKAVFTLGSLGTDLIGAVIASFLLYFYTNVSGIGSVAGGFIILGTRVFDALTDVIMGWIVDRTKSRFGKARPWLLWLAVPYALSAALLFFAPNVGPAFKIIYALTAYNLSSSLLATAVAVPYNTLATVTTDNPKDRASIGIFRMLGTVIAGLLAAVALTPVKALGDGSTTGVSGWLFTMLIFGAIVGVSLLITFAFTKERIGSGEQKTAPVPMKKALSALFRNRNWVLLLCVMLIIQLFGGAAAARPYYAIYILGSENYVTYIYVAYLVPMMASFLFMPFLIKKFGKVNTAIIGSVITVAAYVLNAFFPYNAPMVLVSSVLRGPGFALISTPMISLMGDVIDQEEWRTGLRAEGVANSAFSFAGKFGSGFGVAIVGLLLGIGAAGSSELETTLTVVNENRIIAAAVYFPLALSVIGLILMFFFNIDKQYPKVVKELKRRREGYVSDLKYFEITPQTPEKRDSRLAFARFIPAGVMEKAMRKSLGKLRSAPSGNAGLAQKRMKTADYFIEGYSGEIKLRLYVPETEKTIRPLTLFFHGGGFIGGSMDATDNYCAAYAEKTGEAVLSAEYHLAPEYPFPHGLEDCYLACKWAHDNAAKLKIDAGKITISGDSAGGNFAAAITLLSKQRQEFSVRQMILLYPYTTFGSPQLPMTKVMHKWYLNGADRADPRISPTEGNLTGLPPVLTIICEYDLLAESGKDFAEKLAENGVNSACVMFRKTRHAFLDQMDVLKQTEELLDLIKEWKDGDGCIARAQQSPAGYGIGLVGGG